MTAIGRTPAIHAPIRNMGIPLLHRSRRNEVFVRYLPGFVDNVLRCSPTQFPPVRLLKYQLTSIAVDVGQWKAHLRFVRNAKERDGRVRPGQMRIGDAESFFEISLRIQLVDAKH